MPMATNKWQFNRKAEQPLPYKWIIIIVLAVILIFFLFRYVLKVREIVQP